MVCFYTSWRMDIRVIRLFFVFLFFFVYTDPQEGSVLGDGFIPFAFSVSLFLKIVCPCALPLCDLFSSLASFAHLGRVAFALLAVRSRVCLGKHTLGRPLARSCASMSYPQKEKAHIPAKFTIVFFSIPR